MLKQMGMIDYIANRQVQLDVSLSEGARVDINYMNLEALQRYIEKIDEISYDIIQENSIEER